MSIRTIATFAVAILMGLVAVLLIRSVLSGKPTGITTASAGVTPVVVANGPITRGQTLQPAMLRVVSFPTVSVPTNSFRTVAEVIPAGAPPRVAMREFVANEPLVAAKLSGPGSKANLAGSLTPGMRAVGVRVTDVAGVGGFVLPGDRVDVMVTRQVGSGDKVSSVVQVLAENTRVLGVDQSSEADEPVVAKAVTLEVTPDQAQTISLAQAVGAVTLALRQVADGAPLARRSMTVSDLGGVRAKAPVRRRAAAPQTQTAQVRVTRGVEISGYPMPK